MTLVNLLNGPLTPITTGNTLKLITNSYKLIDEDITDNVAFGQGTLINTEINPDVPKSGYILFVIPSDLHKVILGSINLANNKFLGIQLSF